MGPEVAMGTESARAPRQGQGHFIYPLTYYVLGIHFGAGDLHEDT